MTNKKFKIAAMSMALTACVAAQPLMANAADDVDAAGKSNDASAEQTQDAKSSTQSETAAETKQEEKKVEAPANKEAPADKQIPAFGPGTDSSNVEINYDKPEKDPHDEKTTVSKGDVIDTSKKDESNAEDKSDEKKDETSSEDKTEEKKDETSSEDKTEEKKDETSSEDKTEEKKDETGSEDKTEEKKDESSSEDKTEEKKDETGSEDKAEEKKDESGSEDESDEKKDETSSEDKTEEKKNETKTDGKKDEVPGKIGDATKTETETGSSTEVTPSTDPDDVLGKTEDGKSNIVKGTETTTTTGEGEAESKTDPTTTTTKGDKIDLDKELGKDRENLTWDTKKGSTLNGYKVSGVKKSEDGNSKQLTLTKTDETKGKMSADEIAKLLDVKDVETSEDEEGNKTYTLTRTEDVLDEDGKKIGTRTTVYEVTGDSVTTTTDTTLTIKMEKATAEGREDLPTTEIKLPSITDKETGKEIISAAELKDLLDGQTPDKDGNYKIKREKDGKTYELVISKTTVGEGTTLTDEQLAERLKDNKDYSYKDGKFYYKGAELSNVQINAVRNTLSYDVSITEITKKPDQVEGGGTISDAQQKAEEKVKLEAVKKALNAAAGKYEITLTDDELASVDAANGGTLTVVRDGKTYTFTYEGATVETVETKEDAVAGTDKVDGKDAENVKETTINGTAFVIGGSKSWKDTTQVDSSKNQSVLKNDYTRLPDGMTADEGTQIEKDKYDRIISFVSGGVEYTFKYTDGAELTQAEKDALVKEGVSPDEIKSNITRVTWSTKKVTHPSTETDKDKVLDNGAITENSGKYTIKFGGSTYSGLTKEGDTYTKTEGDTTTTITVSQGAGLEAKTVKEKLAKNYGVDVSDIELGKDEDGTSTATWTDKNGNTVKVRYSDSYSQIFTVKETTKKSTSTDDSANGTYTEQLVSQVQDRMKELAAGDQLILKGKEGQNYTITKTADGKFTISDGTSSKDITLESAVSDAAVKKLTQIIESSCSNSDLDYSKLTAEAIWNLLDIQQQYADGNRNQYTGNRGCDSYWPEQGYENIDPNKGTNENGTYGEGVNTSQWTRTTKFGYLRLDAEVKIDDGKGGTIDGLILSENLKFEYGRKEQIAGYVDINKYPDQNSNGNAYTNKDELHKVTEPKTADLNKNLTTAKGLIWNSTTKKYDSDTKLVYNYGTTSNNSFDGKRFYNISGTVAYDKASTYKTEEAATRAYESLIAANPKARIVAVPNKQTGKTEYVVYKNSAELKAIGYMTATANTNADANSDSSRKGNSYQAWTPGSGAYWGSSNLAGYDLRLQGLKLVNGKAQGNYGVEMRVDLTTIKNTTTTTEKTCTNDTLKINNCVTTTTKTETSGGTDRYGDYTASYTKTDTWEKGTENEAKGEDSAAYRTFTEILKQFFHGTGETTQDEEGSFSYTYRTEENASVEAVSKEEKSTTVAHVGYNYTTVTTKDTIVIVPTEDGGDEDDDPVTPVVPIVTPDTPVTPLDPELPPVQDARPDAVILPAEAETPVLPANPELPAVQDARALPQTGVNWLAAIAMALSGFTLMVSGAWASLTGKNAKH